MLQLEHIRKAYVTAGFTQVALDDVSLAFRDSEFVAILGASGSGKTTMLNILGGLDHADSGDIVINGVSTRDYSDKDWDTYRNHRIGFIFQSYNLIPHQTILSNVELALTLAGVPRAEREERAREALGRVGLGEHVNKRPNQLSGGQMQRVAIARALVNDPDIVLADEPTGALDTETGIQVMDLLQEIARERLVIMVTHNPELAEQYATRIVRLSDGKIIDDTRPLQVETIPDEGTIAPGEAPAASTSAPTAPGRAASVGEDLVTEGALSGEPDPGDASAGDFAKHEPKEASPGPAFPDKAGRRTSMSFLTALALSLSNLMTKKGRTFMTAFAGSIGIIGIAAILALSNGVNSYIATTEEEALSSYPLTITKSSFDLTNLMVASMGVGADDAEADEPAGTIHQSSIMADMFAKVKNNDLRTFGAFLKSDESGVEPYVSSIQFTWGLSPLVYKVDTSAGVSRLNPSRMGQTLTNGLSGSAFLGGSSMSSFTELLDDRRILEQSLNIVEGRWPEAYDECVLVLGRDGGLTDYTLYSLGFYDTKVMDDMTTKALNGEEVEVPETYRPFTMEDAMALRFSVVPANRLYQRNAEQGTWTDMTGDGAYMRQAISEGIDLHVVGVVKRSDEASSSGVPEGIGYTSALTLHLMEEAAASDIVREQRANPEVDVFTGKTFEELREEENRAFDMGSVISVDEEALSRAFSFDTSALASLGQGMDLSGLDLSGLGDMGLGDMMGGAGDEGGLDLSDLDLSGLPAATTSVFTEEALRGLVSGAPRFALSDPTITDEQAAAIDDASTRLSSGFIAWMVAEGHMATGEEPDYATYFPQYLATDEAQAVLADLAANEAMSPESAQEVLEQVSEELPAYMTGTLGPYFQAAFEQLLNQAAAAVMAEVTSQLTAQMSALRNQMAGATSQLGQQLSEAISGQLTSQMSQLSDALSGGFSFDASAFSGAIQFNMTQEDLASLLTNFMNADDLSFEGNLTKLGFAEPDSPDSISIYPIDFEAKESVLGIIDAYNDRMLAAGDDDATIQYSDFAGVLMGSVTDIVNTVSLVLIAFVSISLVVSSIMISIITYISVLERKKEIGILRAMGASKLNIANIFNAETVIEGFIAGVLAIAVVYAASVPVNALILRTRGVPNIMQLPWQSALALVGVSVALTLVAGLIPSSAASRRDPVEALRSE